MKTYKEFLNEAVLMPKEKDIQKVITLIDKIKKDVESGVIKPFRGDKSACEYITDYLYQNKIKNVIFSHENTKYSDVKANQLTFLSGEYYDGDVTLYVAKDFYKLFKKGEDNSRLFKDLYINLEHEFVHLLQDKAVKKAGNDPDDVNYSKKEYMERPDELMAFARNAATELKDIFGIKDAFLVLRRPETYLKQLPTDSRFLEYFNVYKNKPKIYNQFLKYVFQYLENFSPKKKK